MMRLSNMEESDEVHSTKDIKKAERKYDGIQDEGIR